MSKWLPVLVFVLVSSLALPAAAESYKVKADVAQQDQVTQLVLSVLGTKPLPKADFEKKVAELWSRTITFSLSSNQSAAMRRDTKTSVTSTTLRMDNVLDPTKFMGSVRVKDGLYQIAAEGGWNWMHTVEQAPGIHVEYTPPK